ncbi:hypothetical protein GFS24_23130 [Chitinophaga sp. SYP-B3965]|uniref:hypothetical protein n=1 Tax=Chitinophaga sp. SYP-B3965 TaxID=2663120 RepID=UPI001299662B|nr:hypothetical protein [Chitinophaga sp. SYP-B3965]MRG48033.1 hypothetical protein [Chitinophaga sp. SYP-B3965]
MPSFTDTELQMKFCEGFTFFPFKSLEQHGTLIYKCYVSDGGNLTKMLEWNSQEHSLSHYAIKISKKIKHLDIPAATELLQLLQETADWWETRITSRSRMPLAKKLPEYIDKYRNLIAAYHKEALLPIAAKLADKDASISTKSIEQMENLMQQFMLDTETLHHFLKENINKKRPRTLDDEDREYLSKVAGTIDSFRALQERSIYLLEAWETRQMIHNNRRALN